MAGPALDPVKVSQFEKGFNGQSQNTQNPQALASAIAQAYSAKMGVTQSPTSQPTQSASPAPMNEHVMAMQEAADQAKQRYMRENGVDENGDPITQR